MRTSVDTIKTESAVEIAFLFWLKEFQFAASLCVSTANAIEGLTSMADIRRSDFHFGRRDQRLHEVELPDWTNVFAKGCAAKESVNPERCEEISDNDPGRQPRAVPQTESLICPKIQSDEQSSQPLRTQRARPSPARGEQSASCIADKGEWTNHTKEISHH